MKPSGDPHAADQITATGAIPLLLARLHRPMVGPDILRRARLLAHLDQSRHRRLTLISAPSGYGEATSAKMWLEASDCADGWISLDESHNDLVTFVQADEESSVQMNEEGGGLSGAN